ncbi:hypothetical protein V6N11_079127 [Hibiscus sabdariffa]|uniref:Uncharacterized protein n=1 Tax=Hibiscus sabdariffa TaxID=183260 RepID=A0ABR2RUI3_9ROSI
MAKFARGRAEWNRKLLGDIQGDIGKDDEEKYRTMTVGRNKGPCEEGIESRIKELIIRWTVKRELENKIIYRQRGELEATKGTGREAPLLESSSESEEFQSTVRNGHIQGEEIDAINAIVLGKDYNESSLNDTRLLRGHVGDFQFMNNGLKVVKKKVTEDNKSSVETETSKQGEKEDLGSGSKSPRRSWGEVVQRNLESGSNSGTLNSVETITIRAREDLSDMELLNKQVGRPCDLSGKSDELRSFQVMM